MKIAIIGLGLIGGSFALEFKQHHTVYGIDSNRAHQKTALSLDLVKEIISLEQIPLMDVVVIAVPVDVAPQLTVSVLDIITKNTLVFDVGSTKEALCNAIKNHPKRNLFIATHPIAGTEFSGPKAAIKNLFTKKINIICEQHLSDSQQLDKFKTLIKPLQMPLVYMDSAKQHDKHIAYVSHLSHISSFMLGKTVLEIEKEDKTIFNMAGSGFESTVRLAKSSPSTWTPIFSQNKTHIIKALDEYIDNLQAFKSLLEKGDTQTIYNIIKDTNHIKDILNTK